eukprot:scaffold117231_cov32-Tisochrysis_lutea.AAC.4
MTRDLLMLAHHAENAIQLWGRRVSRGLGQRNVALQGLGMSPSGASPCGTRPAAWYNMRQSARRPRTACGNRPGCPRGASGGPLALSAALPSALLTRRLQFSGLLGVTMDHLPELGVVLIICRCIRSSSINSTFTGVSKLGVPAAPPSYRLEYPTNL